MNKKTKILAEQLEEIRSEGRFNMFDFHGVHRRAYELEFFELVTWMTEAGTKGYSKVLFSGKFPDEDE